MFGGLTGDNCRYAPANGVVESNVAVVDVPHLRQHAVDVQPLHEHPGKGAHVEVVEEDGDDGAHKLRETRGESRQKRQVVPFIILFYIISKEFASFSASLLPFSTLTTLSV